MSKTWTFHSDGAPLLEVLVSHLIGFGSLLTRVAIFIEGGLYRMLGRVVT